MHRVVAPGLAAARAGRAALLDAITAAIARPATGGVPRGRRRTDEALARTFFCQPSSLDPHGATLIGVRHGAARIGHTAGKAAAATITHGTTAHRYSRR